MCWRCSCRASSPALADQALRRAAGDGRGRGALCGICIAVALSGIELMQFLAALFALGVGWNFLFIGGTTLFTEAYAPEETHDAQAAMDTFVFGTMTLTSLGSRRAGHHAGLDLAQPRLDRAGGADRRRWSGWRGNGEGRRLPPVDRDAARSGPGGCGGLPNRRIVTLRSLQGVTEWVCSIQSSGPWASSQGGQGGAVAKGTCWRSWSACWRRAVAAGPAAEGWATLIGRFQQGGLGDVIGSWVSTGQNLPVSPDQLGNVLGGDVLSQLTGAEERHVAGRSAGPAVADAAAGGGPADTAAARCRRVAWGDVASILGQLMRR